MLSLEWKMGIDPRQIVASVLTVTMFVMLVDMIKRQHFDSPISNVCFYVSPHYSTHNSIHESAIHQQQPQILTKDKGENLLD